MNMLTIYFGNEGSKTLTQDKLCARFEMLKVNEILSGKSKVSSV